MNKLYDSNKIWTADLVKEARRGEVKAWIVAGIAAIIGLIGFGFGSYGMSTIAPAETVIVRVDTATGALDNFPVRLNKSELPEVGFEPWIDNYFVNLFVKAHERYLFGSIEFDRNKVRIFSANPVYSPWERDHDVLLNESADETVYGDEVSVIVKVKNILSIKAWTNKDGVKLSSVAVDYSRVVISDGGRVSYPYTAYVTHGYFPMNLSIDARRDNPLGWRVVSFTSSQASMKKEYSK